jgi:hypothetical protein
VAGRLYEWVEKQLNRFVEDECSKCGRGPFDSEYDEFGDMIVEAGIKANALAAAVYALTPVLAMTEGPVKLTANILERTGHDELAERVNQFSMLDPALDWLDDSMEDSVEAVSWTEHEGEPICYLCKREIDLE